MPRAHNKPIPSLTEADIARFWSKVDKTPGQGPTGECWPYKGPFTKQGYGRFYVRDDIEIRANRIAYFLTTGQDPGENEACHDCDWQPCCRGSHIHPGTRLDNAREAASRGLYPTGDRNGSRKHPESLRRGDNHPNRMYGVKTKGESNGFAKFKTEQILEIRRLYAEGGVSYNDLAAKFSTYKATICGIITRRSWRHI